MKTKLMLICCLLLSIVQSQELKTIELFPPESKEIADLSFLKDELKGKQVVMLGEYTHMYGNIFEMKARVVEYLHKELGFTTIAMEAPMYDIWKMNKTGFNPDEFNNAIWGAWSGASEFQRLVNYIEKNNLKVVGFDSQVMQTSQFIDDFFDYCESQKIVVRLDEDDFGIIIEGVLDNATVEEGDVKYKSYEKELERIIKQIGKLENNDMNYHWKQFTKSLLAGSKDAYYNKEEILSTSLVNKNHNIRDKQMADNLLSYINRNPDEKIICWADNIHIMNDNSSVKKIIAKDFVSMGVYIKKELKGKSYSLATIHANDSIFDSGVKKWEATPIQSNSFEQKLNSLSKPYLFISSNQVEMRSVISTRLLDFIDFKEERLDQLHDGYIFFQKATLPKSKQEESEVKKEVNIQKKKVDLSKKIKQIEVGQKIILKGQIIEKHSSESIPFATIVVGDGEIYRVADENGFYELPIKKSMMQNEAVEISSMGYKTEKIPLESLKDKTFLEANFQELGEVVVTGYISPEKVLKKAVLNKKINYPVEPFNFNRYAKVRLNNNDKAILDVELITKDFDNGYLSPFRVTHRVEQIKWNKNLFPEKFKYISDFGIHRENAIRYANILHKRKYKKFKLRFIESNDVKDAGVYIIAFETERNKWNYTNRGYPTKYSGRVYIDKENFAIVKVVEDWKTSLNMKELKKYFKGFPTYKNIVEITIKEERICCYDNVSNDGKYYAARYFYRRYEEALNKENKRLYNIFEKDSYLYDLDLKNVEEIEYEHYDNRKEQTVLNRVKYNKAFWDSFYERGISED